MKLIPHKLEGWGYWRISRNPDFNRFWPMHLCDRQTDGRTGDSI